MYYCLFLSLSFPWSFPITFYKSGNKTVPSIYHLISLTFEICKVIERIIKRQVFSFLDRKGCLNTTQHGVRSGRSCLSALSDVFDNIMHMVDSNSSVDIVYLDCCCLYPHLHACLG